MRRRKLAKANPPSRVRQSLLRGTLNSHPSTICICESSPAAYDAGQSASVAAATPSAGRFGLRLSEHGERNQSVGKGHKHGAERGKEEVRSQKPEGPEKEFKWKHNALRHSFISYRVADIQNVAQVALEAGNSPQMIFKHYRELVRPADAQKWFGIAPGGEEKVIAMPKAAAA